MSPDDWLGDLALLKLSSATLLGTIRRSLQSVIAAFKTMIPGEHPDIKF